MRRINGCLFDKNNITVDALFDTYLKAIKPVNCYWATELDKPRSQRAIAFKYNAGDIVGKLYSFVKANNKYFLQFYVNANPSNATYYIELTKGTFDWDFSRQQLERKCNESLTFFGKFASDMENKAAEYIETVTTTLKKGATTAAMILGGFVLVKYILIPELKFWRLKKAITSTTRDVIRTTRKELK